MIDAVEDAEIEEAAVRQEEAAVRKKESTVRKLRLELEEQEAQDQLDARKNREREHTAAQQATMRRLQEEQQHEIWVEGWAERALGSLSADVPGPQRLALHSAIVTRLKDQARTQSDTLTRQLIDAETDKVLAPWRRKRAIDKVVESVCDHLPSAIRNQPEHKARKNQAAQAARKAIEQLGEVPTWQMEVAGEAALKPIVSEFEHEQRCMRLSTGLPSGMMGQEQTEARELIQSTLSQLPVNTSQHRLEQARDEVLAPFRRLLDKREHERRIESLLRWPSLSLPFGMSASDSKQALDEVRAAVTKLPVGTSEQEMEAARDRVVDRIKKEDERQRRVEALIERGLGEIYYYVERLVAKGRLELEYLETTWGIADGLKKPVRKALGDELEGTESQEEVNQIVRELVREELDI